MKDQQTCNIVSSRVILFPQDNVDIVVISMKMNEK